MKTFKDHKFLIFLTCAITLLPMLVGIVLWPRLPDSVATHFGSDGQANGWSSKTFAVFGLPVFLLAVHLVCIFFTAVDPKYQNIGKKIFHLIFWICPVCSLFCGISVYAYALEIPFHISRYILLFLGILLLAIGNYLPKCRQNYTVGIKLPWTLADEENWRRTHRMAGKLWMAGGLALAISAFFETVWIPMGILCVIVVIPCIYSFWYYVKHSRNA